MEEKDRICPTTLLDDDPTQYDEFESHERLADSILDLISTEIHGRSIALTGDWGSGKSTVIKILERKAPDSTRVFTFDAWSHQGDPLRRTFLETLITFLLEKKWLKRQKEWKKQIDKLSRRLRETTTKETPVLTPLGRILVVLAALLPLALALVVLAGPSFDPNIAWPAWAKALFVLAIVVALAPFIVLMVSYATWKIGGRSDGSSTSDEEKDSFVSLLFNKTQTITHSETIETPEPTSVEFQQVFDQLVKESLADEGRKLVIVIDNLDRVKHSDALNIWATMRTFFEPHYVSQAKSRQKLWLVVPFAPDGIKALWEDEGAEKHTMSEAERFVDKTFQIRFRISPPILSRWTNFLSAALEKAFPEHDKREFHGVYRVFQWARSQQAKGQSAPTPREIKMFVNQIGSLHRQWGDDIPLAQQAFFTVKERLGWEPEIDITSAELATKSREVIAHLGTDWREGLAALHLNVPREHALQILMTAGIKDALSEGDGKRLASMKDSSGFLVNLEDVVATMCSRGTDRKDSAIALAALALRDLSEPENQTWDNIWNTLADAAETSINWPLEDIEAVARGLVILIEHRTSDAFCRKLIASVSASSPREGLFAVEWLKSVQIILRTVIEKIDDGEYACEQLSVTGEARDYVKIISSVGRAKIERGLWRFLRPGADTKAITDDLSSLVKSGDYNQDHKYVIETLLDCGVSCEWGNLINELGEVLERAEDITSSMIAPRLWPLIRLQQAEPEARSRLDTISSSGRLMHYLGMISGTDDYRTIALLFIAQFESNVLTTHYEMSEQGTEFFNSVSQKPGDYPEVFDAFFDVIIELSSIDRLFESESRYPEAKELITQTLERMSLEEDVHQLVKPDFLIRTHDSILGRLQTETYHRLMRQLVAKTELLGLICSEDFQRGRSRFYMAVWEVLDDKDKAYSSYLVKGLRNMTTEEWGEQLDTEGEQLRLAIRLHKDGQSLNLGSQLSDALYQHARRVAEGSTKIEQLADDWQYVFEMLADHSRKTLAKNILDDVISDSELSDGLIHNYSSQFDADWSILEPKADDLIRIGFRRFIENKNQFAIRWMKDVAVKYAEQFRQGKYSDSAKDLGERINDALEDESLSMDVQSDLRETAVALGISIPDKRGPEDNVTEGQSS